MGDLSRTISRIFGIVASLVLGIQAQGEGIRKVAHPPAASQPFVQRPHDFPETDNLYRDYFSAKDHDIFVAYRNRWSFDHIEDFQELRRLEDPTLLQQDRAARGQFADFVLRLRVDAAIKTYFSEPERAKHVHRTQKALERVKSYSIPLPAPRGTTTVPPGELRIGYDLITDFSKFEYVSDRYQLGLYQHALVANLSRRASNPAQLRLSIPEGTLPGATLTYHWNAALETSLVRNLTPAIQANLSSVFPVAGVATHAVGVNYSLSF